MQTCIKFFRLPPSLLKKKRELYLPNSFQVIFGTAKYFTKRHVMLFDRGKNKEKKQFPTFIWLREKNVLYYILKHQTTYDILQNFNAMWLNTIFKY